MATTNESSNSTIVKPVILAPPAKTIPVDDIPIEPIADTPINETPIAEQMQVKEQAQLEDGADPTDETTIEEKPLVDDQEPIAETPEPVITEPPAVVLEKSPAQTQPAIEDVRQEPIIPAPPEPVITEPATVAQEKPASQPTNGGLKWCHTDENLTYTGDYYTVTSGTRGEVYLGANNKNEEFIIIPVQK